MTSCTGSRISGEPYINETPPIFRFTRNHDPSTLPSPKNGLDKDPTDLEHESTRYEQSQINRCESDPRKEEPAPRCLTISAASLHIAGWRRIMKHLARYRWMMSVARNGSHAQHFQSMEQRSKKESPLKSKQMMRRVVAWMKLRAKKAFHSADTTTTTPTAVAFGSTGSLQGDRSILVGSEGGISTQAVLPGSSESDSSSTASTSISEHQWNRYFGSRLFGTLSKFNRLRQSKNESLHQPRDEQSLVFSVSSTKSKDHGTAAAVSLDEFMKGNGPHSTFPSFIDLADIAADDSASICSAQLGVSFDEEYAQLVFTQRSSEDDCDIYIPGEPLGISCAHPASKQSQSPCSITANLKRSPEYAVQIHTDDSIDDVWNDVDSFDLKDELSMPHSPVNIKTKPTSWDETDLGWSFSQDGTVATFSSILGENLLQPIYRLASDCGISGYTDDEDHPFDEPAFAVSSVVSHSSSISHSSYKMIPVNK